PTTVSHSDASTCPGQRPLASSASTRAATSWVRLWTGPDTHTAFSRSDHASRRKEPLRSRRERRRLLEADTQAAVDGAAPERRPGVDGQAAIKRSVRRTHGT